MGRRGIILFSIRDRISASATTAGSAEGVPYGFVQCFDRLAEIGYRQIEFAGYNQSTSILGRQITPAEIRTALDNAGLNAIGSHGNIPGTITPETLAAFDAYCETAATLGQVFIGTGGDPTGSAFKADWDAACERWNILGERARTNFGLRLYTHNHDAAYNFLLDSGPLDTLGRPTRSSGIRRLEYFLTCTDKRYVFLQMDVYWAHVAQHRWIAVHEPGRRRHAGHLRPGRTGGRELAAVPDLPLQGRDPDHRIPPASGTATSSLPSGSATSTSRPSSTGSASARRRTRTGSRTTLPAGRPTPASRSSSRRSPTTTWRRSSRTDQWGGAPVSRRPASPQEPARNGKPLFPGGRRKRCPTVIRPAQHDLGSAVARCLPLRRPASG